MRYLLIAILVVAAVLIWRSITRSARDSGPPKSKGGRMVRCEKCGVYVPEEDACRRGDHYFCSDEHRGPDPG